MKKFSANRFILMPGEHQILLPSGTKLPGYKPDSSNITDKPFKIVQDQDYISYITYDLYINNIDVIVSKTNQNTPGIPKITFEQEQNNEVIFAPKTHEVYLPYFVSVLKKGGPYFDYMEQTTKEYPGYEPVSDKTYEVIDKLDYVVYKLYTNSVEVALLIKGLDENTPGKPLVKTKK